MTAHQKKWWIIGGSVAAVVVIGWFVFGGSDPESDLKSTSRDKRMLAIEALEKTDTPSAARVIAAYTTDNDIEVARRSLFAIGRMRKGGDTKVIVDALGHKQDDIREAAVVAMGMRGEKADLAAVRDRLARDPSVKVRTAAAAELGAKRDWESVPLLVAAMDSQDETLSNVAIRCLLDIGGREHEGFKPGATPAQRAQAIRSLKNDWQSFGSVNTEYKRYKEIMKK